jgi:uncharacterized repeat protein (TIGR03806 family)
MIKHAFTALWLALTLAACGGGGGGNISNAGSTSAAAAVGLDQRVPASGLQIPTGATGGKPLTAVELVPGLRLSTLTFITHAGDGSNRLFAVQRDGIVTVISDIAGSPKTSTFLDLTSSVNTDGEGGLLGLAFDPGFRSNSYFYVAYSLLDSAGARKLRVSRFRVSAGNANSADSASERVLLDLDRSRSYHYGGWIGFAPDGTLYISHGDGGNEQSVENNPQNRDSLFGKILRIRVNADGSYAIPSDNPFGTAVWAIGLRNPWRCSFDRANGDLWCGDVGANLLEEVNRVERGANHGWPLFEGSLANPDLGGQHSTAFTLPIYQYDHSLGIAVVGGYVYRGTALPGMAGKYLYTDVASPNLWAIELDSSGSLVSNTVVADNLNAIFSLGEDEVGELYAVAQDGAVYRIAVSALPDAPASEMPATLSATGLFTDLTLLTPAPGLIDYEVNSPLWSDGARKRRWFVLPGAETIGFDADGAWTFPVGTITVKHFELAQAGGGTRRVETRVMVHRPGGWVGHTYRWRDDQRDADLQLTAATATYDTIDPTTGTGVRVNWTFPSQSQCLSCHTQATGRVLGLNTLQFNRDHEYASTGRTGNQLLTLDHIGVFGQDIGDLSQYGALPDPYGTSGSLDSRAKSYLETNCSVCHRPGSTAPVSIDLRYGKALADMKLVGVAADQPTTAGAVRVVAGNHAASDLWRRVAATDGNRMPVLGVSVPDQEALKLLADWIDSVQ